MAVSRRLLALLLVLAVVGGPLAGSAVAAPATPTGSFGAPRGATTDRLVEDMDERTIRQNIDGMLASTVAVASAIQPGAVNRTSMALRATYAVDASIDVDTGVVRVTATISARNDSGAGIDRVELNTIAARLGGGLVITTSKVDGVPVAVTVSDQTLKVPLGGILPAGATVELEIGYRATLRTSFSKSNWMFTRGGGTIAMYRWIPWVSLARPFDRQNIGDPFIVGSSPEVVVRLALSKPRIVAAPVGVPTAASKTWSFTVRDVRDVALVMAPDFTVNVRYVDGVRIRAYSRPGGVTGGRLADLAKLALGRMTTRLGVAYPWPQLVVAETAGGLGLESPGLIWVPGSTPSGNLSYLVHHELAHQWFYGLVGNDQQREPFADEAAADLLARTVLGTLRPSRCATDVLDKRITGYSSACYYETIYIQGGNQLDAYRRWMGTSLFWATVRDYLETYRHRIAGTRVLLEMLREASPADLLPSFRKRFPNLY
ncbi:MAG TPA: hypothetical protein VNL94_06845 [Candidatus Binatia bacterium]|nr:hypothetical protein [Candidatus Binatia bacterium]